MRSRFEYLLLRILIIVAAMAINSNRIYGQVEAAFPDAVQVHFLKDSIESEEGEFGFNHISISNSSQTPIHIKVQFLPSDAVNIISANTAEVEIRPGVSEIIPIRYTISRRSLAARWYQVKIDLHLKEAGRLQRMSFYVKPKETVNWKLSLRNPMVTFLETDKEIPFGVILENTGNTEDNYTFRFDTRLKLSVPGDNYSVRLTPGERKEIQFAVSLRPNEIRALHSEEISVFVKNGMGEQKMILQSIAKMGSVFLGESSRWNKMPLTVEMNFQNLFSDQPFAFLTARGYLPLKGKGQLGIFVQTDNYYHGLSSDSKILTAEYRQGPWSFTAGSIIGFNNFLIDGTGGKIQYENPNRQSYEIMGAKSRIGNINQFNFKTAQPFGKDMVFSSNVFINRDLEKRENSSLVQNKLQWQLAPNTVFSIQAGGGMNKVDHEKLDTAMNGISGGYSFETKQKHFQINSAWDVYSKNFPGINKGFRYQSHEARILLNNLFAGPYFELNERSYNDAGDSLINFLYNIHNKEFGFRTGFQGRNISLAVSPGILDQLQDSSNALQARMYKVSLNLNWKINEQWWLSVFSNAGRVAIDDIQNHSSFNSFTNFINLQSGRFGMQLRYDHGPYYYYEISQYIKSPVEYDRIQAAPYFDLNFPEKNLLWRLQMNYQKETQSNTEFLLLYNNLQYSIPNTGMEIGLTAQKSLLDNESPLINFTIRKRLELPVYRNGKSRTFKVVAFLDRNNNNWPDEGEERVTNARVTVNGSVLKTNEKGEMIFKNTENDDFRMDFSEAITVKGWMPQNGYRQLVKVDKSRKLVFIPFKKSRILSGKLILIRDEKSSLSMQLDGIRMIATSSIGETYQTLTDLNGEFFFNLPAGNYIVSINQAVFDENFRPVETSRAADLYNNSVLDLPFEIRQKMRHMNIRKQ